MQSLESEDRATRIGNLIGTLVVLAIAAVIAVDLANAVSRLQL